MKCTGKNKETKKEETMSGGHWHYAGEKIHNLLTTIAIDQDVRARWPRLSKLFGRLAPVLAYIEEEMDWDLSGDTKIEDDAAFADTRIEILKEAIRDV